MNVQVFIKFGMNGKTDRGTYIIEENDVAKMMYYKVEYLKAYFPSKGLSLLMVIKCNVKS